jgi:hypothetical protein
VLTHDKHPHLPDQIIDLCLWWFDTYESAIAANPLGRADCIKWCSIGSFNVARYGAGDPSSLSVTSEVHSARISQNEAGWFYWQLSREDDRKAMAQVCQSYAL